VAVDALNPNIAARLAVRAARHPGRTAIVDLRGGRRRVLAFGTLAERVAALAAGLEARGVRAGDPVLLFVPMSAELYVALLAVLHAGAHAVFVDAWGGRARLDAAVAAARPRAFIAVPRAHALRLVSPALRAIPHHVMAGAPFPLRRLERPAAAREAAAVTADDLALVTFTTGSTGRPKAAARTHGFLWAQHEALAEHLGLTEQDVDLVTLPVFVLNNLALGVTSVIPDFDPRRPGDIRPARIHANLVAEGVTTLAASPGFCETLAAWCDAHGRRIPLRRLFTGGAPVLPALARRLVATVEGEAHVLYGSTEAEPISGIAARDMADATTPRVDGLCVGRPIARIDVRIVRAHDGPIVLDGSGWPAWDAPPGESGEIVVAGAHVLRGYLDDPASDAANKIRDGDRVWHRTGDAGRLDAEGRLWLVGRLGRRVRRQGAVWWPLPAELRALRVAGVAFAAYFGEPSGADDQQAVLCVERAPGGPDPDRDALAAALSPWPLDRLHVLERIPRDPRHQSKADHGALIRRLAAR